MPPLLCGWWIGLFFYYTGRAIFCKRESEDHSAVGVFCCDAAKPETDEPACQKGGYDGAFAQSGQVAATVERDGDGDEDARYVEADLCEAEVKSEAVGDRLYGSFARQDNEVGDDEKGDAERGDEAGGDEEREAHQVCIDEKVL